MNQSGPTVRRYSPRIILIFLVIIAASTVAAAMIVDLFLPAHTWIRALVPAVTLLVGLPLLRRWEARNAPTKDDDRPAN